MRVIRDQARELAHTIKKHTPQGADQSAEAPEGPKPLLGADKQLPRCGAEGQGCGECPEDGCPQ